MNKKALEAFAGEAAKSIKIEFVATFVVCVCF